MERYVIKDKNNSKLFFLPKDPGGYCDWIDTDEQLETVLKDPTSIVYFDSFDHAWEHLSGNENGMDVYLLEGTTDVYESVPENDKPYASRHYIQYFGTIEKLAQ